MPTEKLLLDFSRLTHQAQAQKILQRASEIAKGNPHQLVGITYSANASQTEDIRKAYKKQQQPKIVGANQAMVLNHVLDGIKNDKVYALLKKQFRIIPVTTMDVYGGNVNNEVIEQDLEALKDFIKNRNYLLLWTNQLAPNRVAIGGGIKALPEKQNAMIQDFFQKL